MSRLVELMDEMAAKIQAATDAALAADQFRVQVVGRLNSDPTPPSIDIYPGDPFRDVETAAFGDRGEIFFTVRARVSTADQDAGQELLLSLMDDEDDLSVAVILEDDQTLNGLAASVRVEGPSAWVVFADAGQTRGNSGALLGCTWRVTVLNARS